MEDVGSKVLDIIAARLKKDRAQLTRETPLEDLNIDSLDFVEIMFELEDAFDISIPYNANSEDRTKFSTAGDVVNEVEKIVAEAGRGAQ